MAATESRAFPRTAWCSATLESTALADGMSEDDTMLAVSAVVTLDGRVSDLLVLGNERHGRQVSSILDAISQARLQPAELAGSPVAVNLVWLLAQTTVKPKSGPDPIQVASAFRRDLPSGRVTVGASPPPSRRCSSHRWRE